MKTSRVFALLRASFMTKSTAFALALCCCMATASHATPIAFDMVNSTSLNLISFTNPFTGAFASAGDGFQKYQRGVSPTIPFGVLDDSLSIFPPDTLGIIGESNTDEFFGVIDTENPQNSGAVSATWVFDISGASGLALSVNMGAMGDFESTDFFTWDYSIDGGVLLNAFASAVDETGSFVYTMDGGANVALDDPMLIQGMILTNTLATFTSPITGTGSQLALTLTAMMDGGGEAVAFQNLIIESVSVPEPSTLALFAIALAGFGVARRRVH